ncbi:beta-phosphoglucomutase [Fulvivirgaceae bacterium PWU20]|uniref:Beta-phosphoglucomutase n=1 Tax=Chryseosolibacter indicus TaxID=2782351 RepID=A0ABS5VZ51_9BACT|nr:beta-phosphoglucomutase [Chryseosolibacter indicus]
MIKACIFDLDGVIVDTAHYHFLAWKRLANELGIDLTIEDNERLKGVSRLDSLEIILNLRGISLPTEEKERLANKKNSWFVDYVLRMSPDEIFPGVKQLIHELKKQNIKIGLASSSKNAKTVIHLLQIENEFDAIVDGTMIRYSKPDPEIFILAASKLGVEPQHCLVFEDAEAGVEAALAAGMKCVGIGSANQLGKADIVISKTGEFNIATLQQLSTV